MKLTFMINKIKMVFMVNICLIMVYPELFSQLDESKRAKKMLELAVDAGPMGYPARKREDLA